jgi:hypothetical protein
MSEITASDSCRLWIQGPPGSGKTELLQQVMSQYLSFSSIEKAYRIYSFIPILIPLRNTRGGSVLDLARKPLATAGLNFESAYLEKLMANGKFLLLIDGANEVDMDKELLDFFVTHPSVGCIITSQSSPPRNFGDTAVLPEIKGTFAQSLFMAMSKGDNERKRGVLNNEIWDEVKSGFDVKLLATLYEKDLAFPKTRIELFAASLHAAYDKFSITSVPPSIFRLAWKMWCGGLRAFRTGSELPLSDVQPLIEDRLVVPRGDNLEFSHDLLRGYLAAAWCVEFSASTKAMLARLDEKSIWTLSPTEQDLVFSLFVSLLSAESILQTLFSFATEDAELRTRLVVACINRAQELGCELNTGVPRLNRPDVVQ